MTAGEAIIQQHKQFVMPTYAPELVLVKGRGSYVWDAEGKSYLDFLSGIAVVNVGHCHPKVVRAIRQQSARLMHVSNLYYNEQQPLLAKSLSELSIGGKCFFCNSGAEANEALIKLARLWGKEHGQHEVITMKNSFHGRTLATLTATGQEKVKLGFDPLPAGFRQADFNYLESIKSAITPQTAAVLVEAVQGEGGVVPAEADFMQGLRKLCTEKNILLLCDEVQCGMGRTGHWFGYQAYGIEPDAISLAKGLGGGFPIGAIVTTPRVADVFQPGHHASTFGGTPLACAAARAVIGVMEQGNLVENAKVMGDLFVKKLDKVVRKHAFLTGIRGRGLMLGILMDRPAKDLERLSCKKGLLCLATAGNVLRFLPPLNVNKTQIARAVKIIRQACVELETHEKPAES